MNKIYYIALVMLLFMCYGCNNTCPKGYNYYNNRCYKYENMNAKISYYCNRGGELKGNKCIITEEYNCSKISDKEICTNEYEYLASKEYTCPKGYELSGQKCSKIKYLK